MMNTEKVMKMHGDVETSSVTRKEKVVHTTADDNRLQSTFEEIGVNTLPGFVEVNIFKDETVIRFLNPKVQVATTANAWVVSGSPQIKNLRDILPGILNQLGPDSLDRLKKLAKQFQFQKRTLDDDDSEAAGGEGQKS